MATSELNNSDAINEPPSPVKIDPNIDHEEGTGDDDESDDSVLSSPRRGKKKRDSSTLRKAPQAPKRFKSSYICFFMAKQAEIKEELGDKATVTEISKRSAEMWRNLPSDEREHWDEIAAKDKQRYLVEKASYTGPWQVPYKRARKDPSAPKRPMSAFLYFSQGRRQHIKEKHPEMKNTEVSRLLGEQWRNATDEERKPYIEKEREEREKYKVSIADWRENFEKKKEEQRHLEASRLSHIFSHQQPPYPLHESGDHHSQYSRMLHGQAHAYNMPPPPSDHPYGHQYPPPPHAAQHYYAPPPPVPYRYPTNGKNPIILSPSGMPCYYSSLPPPPHYDPPPPTDYEEHQESLSPPQNFDYVVDQVSEPQTAE